MSEDIKQKIQEVLSNPQLGVLSTVTEDGNPWCRYVFIMTDSDMNIRCATFAEARKAKQIAKNNEVHITCGVGSLEDAKPYLQIQGKASISTDQAEKDAFWNPGLVDIFQTKDNPNYAVIITEPYRIEYCRTDTHDSEVWEK